MDKETLHQFFQQLNEHGYRIRKPNIGSKGVFDLHLADLSKWKLRLAGDLSQWTPLLWIKPEILSQLTTLDLVDSLQDVVREQKWQHRDCIVLLDCNGMELRSQVSNQHYPHFIIIDKDDQQRIISAHSFTGAIQDLICEQIPLASLAPYQVGGAVQGNSFFGRNTQLNKILSQGGSSFAIFGIRRIGKTSLLKEARRKLLERGENPSRIVQIDCSTLSGPKAFVQEIVRELHLREITRLDQPEKHFFYFVGFLKRMSKMHGGLINIFLDEFDKLLQWDYTTRGLLTALRSSFDNDYCRYIVAGHDVLKREIYDINSPLYMAFQPLSLGPFERSDTEIAVLEPMQSLRIRFENASEIVSRIHSDTQGYPLLVQYYCQQLIEQMDQSGTRIIDQDKLIRIYNSRDFRNMLVETFWEIGFKEQVLVYALLSYFSDNKDTFTEDEMYGALQKQGCNLLPSEIIRICDYLEIAGIFARDGQIFSFANPLFPRIMRANHNIKHLLSVAKKEI